VRSFQLSFLSLDVLEGDLSAQSVDAVVNAANNELWMGAGVAGALKARGGHEIEREAMALGPISPGEAVVTTAGRLPAAYVIHAAVMGQDLRTDAALIASATAAALAQAERLGLRSVAFPALGTGVGGFPLEQFAGIMVDAVRAHAAASGTLRRVLLVLYGRQAYETVVSAVAGLLGSERVDHGGHA
jgi:O-acetyl-ADP-ribose deacetylase (regulator of RNase III)